MLSYQHQYHAGNHANVLKHWTLLHCLRHLQRKAKPFDYIDTHAGAGDYRLDSSEAQKTGEYRTGIGKLGCAALPGFEDYLAVVGPALERQHYPGSPALVNQLLRPGDHSWLFELHPQTLQHLQRHCAVKGQTFVRNENGLAGLQALLPVTSRRALVLIDPSYEVKTEYDSVFEALAKAWQKMPQSVFLLWYPVVERARINRLEQHFRRSKLRDVHSFEMAIADDDSGGMSASGLIVVNPPYTLAAAFAGAIPALSALLSGDGRSRTRHEVLRPE